MADHIVRRIFGSRTLPTNLSDAEMDKYFNSNFPKWTAEFEESGFLDEVKVPAIDGEDDFLEKLRQHRDDLLVIKFWKRGCIPCLALSEMFKAAEKQCASDGRRVVFYSVDTKSPLAKELVSNELVDGTPTFQAYKGYRQIGDQIRETNLKAFLEQVGNLEKSA